MNISHNFVYKFVKDENGEVQYCNTCRCEAMVCEFNNPYLPNAVKEPKVFLCEICASTNVGSQIRLRNQELSPLAFAQAMNVILVKLAELKK